MAQTTTTTTSVSSTNFKVSRQYNSDPWAILITLASIIIVATAIAIVGICMLWERYRKSRQLFERGGGGGGGLAGAVGSVIGNSLRRRSGAGGNGGSGGGAINDSSVIDEIGSAVPVGQMPSTSGISYKRPKEYEVQSLDMFVPVDDREEIGEIMINSKEGIRPSKQYQQLEKQYHQLPQVQHLHQMHQMQQQLQQQQLQLQQMQNSMINPAQPLNYHNGYRYNLNSYSLDPNMTDDNITNNNNNNSLYKRVMHYSKLSKNNMIMDNNLNQVNSTEFMEQ